MTEAKSHIEDGFLSLLNTEYMKDRNMKRGNPYWSQIKRDFSNVYVNEIPCYIHFEKAGVSLYEGYQYDIRKLLGYMVSNDIVSFNGGVSIGSALKQMERKDSVLNAVINGSEYQVIQEIYNYVGLMRSYKVKINAFNFIRDMYNWKAQKSNGNKNWVCKLWAHDYFNTKKEG